VKVRFSGDALRAVKKAHAEYRQKSPSLARSFVAEVHRVRDLIGDFPDLGRPFGQYRRLPLRRFPFVVYFEHKASYIEMTDLVHQASDSEAPIDHDAVS
jgi:plasmid stabilization system protein ParE